MNHYEPAQWRCYVKHEGLTESERDAMERHLQRCDTCLDMYMSQIEAAAAPPAMATGDAEFADRIVGRTMRTRRSLLRSSMLHYGIAAAATLILVVSGVFHGLTQEVNAKMLNSSRTAPQETVSDQLMNHTLQWLDKIKKEDDNGGFFP